MNTPGPASTLHFIATVCPATRRAHSCSRCCSAKPAHISAKNATIAGSAAITSPRSAKRLAASSAMRSSTAPSSPASSTSSGSPPSVSPSRRDRRRRLLTCLPLHRSLEVVARLGAAQEPALFLREPQRPQPIGVDRVEHRAVHRLVLDEAVERDEPDAADRRQAAHQRRRASPARSAATSGVASSAWSTPMSAPRDQGREGNPCQPVTRRTGRHASHSSPSLATASSTESRSPSARPAEARTPARRTGSAPARERPVRASARGRAGPAPRALGAMSSLRSAADDRRGDRRRR